MQKHQLKAIIMAALLNGRLTTLLAADAEQLQQRMADSSTIADQILNFCLAEVNIENEE